MQVETRPSFDAAPGRAASSRRPIRIVAPTVSGRRWREASPAGEPGEAASAPAPAPTDLAVFLAAFEPR
jgi:hypothetical protein